MKLLPAPRFHIMSADEITQSIRRVNVEDRISRLKDELRRVEWELRSAEDHRDWMHQTGMYDPIWFGGNFKKLMWEWYYQ